MERRELCFDAVECLRTALAPVQTCISDASYGVTLGVDFEMIITLDESM